MSINIKPTHSMTIGGSSVDVNETFEVVNPADGSIVGLAPDCTPEQLDDAVSAARSAFPEWSARSWAERRGVLLSVADAIEAEAEALARLLTSEQGKTLSDAAGEIAGAAYWFRETAQLSIADTVNEDNADRLSVTRHVPLGVVGAIAPWNFPIGLATFKLAPALLAGNTVVLKPSPFTPLTTLAVGQILQGVLPPGVLNVVSGGDDLGPWLTAHRGIDKISFTGSTQTGRKVMESAAASLKRVTLELGGNDAAIVLPDVDVDETVEKLFWGAFGNSGQVCLAAKRVYVHADVYDEFRDALTTYAKGVVVGDGTADGVQLGPVQNIRQYTLVTGLIRDSLDQGHTLTVGGLPDDAPGFIVPLTIVDNPPEDSRIVQEEQFGPVLPLLKFTDIDDAVARANDCAYGLGASVWSSDTEAAFDIAGRLAAGMVWVNEIQHLTPTVTFAGHKQSGIGTESGLEGLHEYVIPQTRTIRRGREISASYA